MTLSPLPTPSSDGSRGCAPHSRAESAHHGHCVLSSYHLPCTCGWALPVLSCVPLWSWCLQHFLQKVGKVLGMSPCLKEHYRCRKESSLFLFDILISSQQ